MIPIICQVPHKPDEGKYGDCMRACIASILEIEPPTDVPHFYDGGDLDTGNARLTEYLSSRGLTMYVLNLEFPTLEMVLAELKSMHGHYVLMGKLASGGNHAVVCKADAVVHDPNWVKSPMVSPAADGLWQALIIAVA